MLGIAAGAAAGAVIFAMLPGAGTHAAWRDAVPLEGSLTAGTMGLTIEGLDALDGFEFTAGDPAAEALVTVTNTGDVPVETLTATASSTGSTSLAGAVTVRAWPAGSATSAAQCTAPSGPAGTWASMPDWLAGQAPLAPGGSVRLCVSTSMSPGAITANPGTSVTPTVTVEGTNGWRTAASATVTQSVAAAETPPGWTMCTPAAGEGGPATFQFANPEGMTDADKSIPYVLWMDGTQVAPADHPDGWYPVIVIGSPQIEAWIAAGGSLPAGHWPNVPSDFVPIVVEITHPSFPGRVIAGGTIWVAQGHWPGQHTIACAQP
jgi:hypothetical protein